MCFGWGERRKRFCRVNGFKYNQCHQFMCVPASSHNLAWKNKLILWLSIFFSLPAEAHHTHDFCTLYEFVERGGGDGKFSPQSCLKHSLAAHKSESCDVVWAEEKIPKWKPSFQTREFPVLRSTAKTCRKAKWKLREVGRCVQPEIVCEGHSIMREKWRLIELSEFTHMHNSKLRKIIQIKLIIIARKVQKILPLVLVKSDFFTIRFASVNQPT